MATIVHTNAVVPSSCELYSRARKSLLESLPFVKFVKTTTTVTEISLLPEVGFPMTILVDAPGSEHRVALQIGRFYKHCHSFFVVNDYQLHTILPLLKLGITGFTARGDSISNFMKAFLVSAKGQIGLLPDIAKRAAIELASDRRRHTTLPSDLTRRETEMLQLLADGMGNRDIAQTLFLSVRTVEAHLRNLYGKLDVNSRIEAALWAVRHGYAPFVG